MGDAVSEIGSGSRRGLLAARRLSSPMVLTRQILTSTDRTACRLAGHACFWAGSTLQQMVTGCSCGGVYFFKPRGGRIIEGHNSFDLANRSHNSGSGFVSIGSIAASGDFVQTNTCSSSLNPNGKCNISVSFRPTAIGSRSGVLKITDNAARSPQRIPLTGTGLKSPQASLSSSSLSFASQSVGTVSVAQAVTVSNTGTAPLVFSRIAASGDFIQSNTCGSSLAIGASCAISVSFQPGAIGTRTGALKIADN